MVQISFFAGLEHRVQAQRLTEFLASNILGKKDEDGTPQPWVEIWNPNQTTFLTLTGHKLTNGTDIYAIPTIRIVPDERIIIWASGKNRSVVTAPLHTNFKLGTDAGSSISLLNASNAVVSTFTGYPAQVADVSWGRDDADVAVNPVLVGSYSNPSPAEKNSNYSGSGVAGRVAFSQTSRAFNTSPADATITLTLSQILPDPAAEIRYTAPFNNMTGGRQQHTATLLPSGSLLVTGGTASSAAIATAEIFGASWAPAASMTGARRQHTATLLNTGKVLIVGGLSTVALDTTQLYDPATNTWSAAAPLAAARSAHTATLLNDGRVLIAGGLGAGPLDTSEVYDPIANTWTASGNLGSARQLHTATLLSDGRVLALGGLGAAALETAEIFDSTTGTWTAAAPLAEARQLHTATLLVSGKVLVTGGTGVGATALASVEIYDPAANTWTAAPPLAGARRQHTATRLPDGKVLVAAGNGTASINSTQIYDPALDAWAASTSLTGIRQSHTATLLKDGRVFVAGGSSGATSLATSEIYSPASNTWINSPRQASLPDATSPLYTGPLTIASTTLLRARIFKPGILPGATNSQAFLRLENNAASFSSAMPIVVINTFGVTPPDDGDLASYMWVWEPAAPDNRARFTNPPVIARRTVVDKRGSSTLGNAKFSLNVETRTTYDEDAAGVSLLGMPEHPDWVFHAPFSFDPSLLHNPLSYDISNAIGRYAVRNRMAEVFMDVNGGGLNFPGGATGDYFGIYNVMEKIRRGTDRVDISRLETYDNDVVSNTGGYIFKIDRQDPGDSGFSAGGQTWAYYYPKERDLLAPQRAPQKAYLTSYLNSVNTRLNAPTFADPVLGYAPLIDVPAAIDHHLLNVWTFNVDALRLSGYWTKDRSGKIFPGPIWDFDRALSSTDGRDSNPLVWRSASGDLGTDFFNYPWWTRLFRDPDFYQKYIDRWQEIRTGALSRSNLEARIDALNAQFSTEGIARDLARWNQAKRSWRRPFAAPENNNIPASQAAEVQRLKDYLQQRATFFDSQWVGPVTASAPSGFLAPGSTVILTGPAGVPVYYTLDGTDPRPAGGAAPGAGATLYADPIPVSGNVRVRARAYNAAHTARTGANNPPLISKWGAPADATYTTETLVAPGDLIISEIHFHPVDPSPAELAINPAWQDGDFEFLELRNISGHPVNLTGANFTRGITFSFTAGAARSLAAGESLILVSNPAAFAARYGAAPVVSGPWLGNLSNGGENITLVTATGTILLSVEYKDSWVPSADGTGPSLVAAQYYPADFSASAAWLGSAVAGGSPGAWDKNSQEVSAGPDISNAGVATLTLRGEIPGTLPGPASTAWTLISGPGSLTFGDPTALQTTATPGVPGSYRVLLTLTAGGVTRSDEASLHFGETLAAWIARYPGIGAITDDFDQDGRVNLLEFAFLTDPTIPNGDDPVTMTNRSGRPALQYQRRAAGFGVVYQIEISDTLGVFRLPNDGELKETILQDTGVAQTVSVSEVAGTGVQRYLRIKVATGP